MARKSKYRKNKTFLYGIILGALINQFFSTHSVNELKLMIIDSKNSLISLLEDNKTLFERIRSSQITTNLFK